jgi:hypothetical protein
VAYWAHKREIKNGYPTGRSENREAIDQARSDQRTKTKSLGEQ